MNKEETPLSLKKICDLEGWNYNTVRRHRTRWKKIFPKAVTTRVDGDGTSWYPSELREFYRTKTDGRTARFRNDNNSKPKTI